MNKPTLYLIDGSGYIFRAYYAIRSLSTSQGEPTNAVRGFATMIKNLLEQHKPELLAIVFDVDRESFRTQIYPAYKANRSPPPEDLVPQVPRIHQVAEAFRIPMFRETGVEADDVIATLARLAVEDGHEVQIISGDKDLMQLVTEHVTVYEPMKNKRYAAPEVEEKFGVPPAKLLDLFALAGDSSDNVPGVKGIGPKTGATLLHAHGDLESVLAAAARGEVKGKNGERLVTDAENARLSKRLIQLRDTVALDRGLSDLVYHGPDADALRTLYETLEFRDLMRNLGPATPDPDRERAIERPAAASLVHDRYRAVTDVAGLEALRAAIVKKGSVSIALQTETERLVDTEVLALAFALEPGEAVFIPCVGPDSIPARAIFEHLAAEIRNPEIKKASDDLKALVEVALRFGIEVEGLAFDCALASYLLDPDEVSHEPRTVARRLLGLEPLAPTDVFGSGRNKKTFRDLEPARAAAYLGEAAEIALRGSRALPAELARVEVDHVFADVELPLVPVIAQMERAGMRIDLGQLSEMSATFAQEISRLEAECFQAAGHTLNLDSPKQLQAVLYDELGLKKLKGNSTDASVLEQLLDAHELPGLVLEYRQVKKLQSTYVDALPKMIAPSTGRVHTQLKQAVAATGRLSSADPNLQNIPIRSELGRQIRKVFIAGDGKKLISCDYSQIELRVLAHFSEEPVLIQAFADRADVHTRTASVLFGVEPEQVTREQRTQAKAVNFGVLYGMGPVRLARQLQIPRRTASQFVNDYFERQPKVLSFVEETVEFAQTNGFVRTLLGRRRKLPDIASKNRADRAQAERMAKNTPIQGSAADLIKLAMIRVYHGLRELFPEARLLLQVHDELLVEAPEAIASEVAAFVQQAMERVYPLHVPLVAEPHIGTSWAEAH